MGIQGGREHRYAGDGYPRERVGMSGGVGIHEGGWISWGMGIQGGREHRYAGGGYLRERVTMPQVIISRDCVPSQQRIYIRESFFKYLL